MDACGQLFTLLKTYGLKLMNNEHLDKAFEDLCSMEDIVETLTPSITSVI